MMPRLTPGRLRVFLAVSIALNLFLVALVGAQRWRAVHVQRIAMPAVGLLEGRGIQDPEGTLQQFGAGLSSDDAAILRGAVRARLGELLNARRGFVAAVERTREEIARDPIDPVALREAIVEARRQRQRFGPVLESILLDAVPRMTPEGRRALSRIRGVGGP
ncbi:periplasmic heavy metal sensor [Neoroseomonas lacus]|uniref:Periplasmic heavy metal sensor n=1 Tax=Neoroseomonas lacus TaxID=287609 RepID=A0A917KXW4_9PROT|nr:periplasmic heavy metal sensor [Neoroseomonas lacus]GGJ35400.1 hypothetical protein GCM10011320_48950 [Neoroseomonas lacus]